MGSAFQVRGSVAMVTGGSSGIGEQIAYALAKDGAKVAVLASGDIKKAEAVVAAISKDGGTAAPFACDVRDAAAVAATVAAVEKQLGPVDILVNSAGVFYPTPAGATPTPDADRTVDINLKGPWNAISAVVPGMKARKRGRIVSLASVAGVVGIANFGLYCATKGAIIMMTKALARELAPFDININAIAPGNTATPMNDGIRNDPANAAFMAEFKRMTPSNTIFSDPADIAQAAMFLLSPAARAMHGSVLLIDEGVATGI